MALIPFALEQNANALAGAGTLLTESVPAVQGIPEVLVTVPVGQVHYIKGLTFNLSADVVLTDLRRLWFVVIEPGGQPVLLLPVDALQLPGTIRRYSWALNITDAYDVVLPLFNTSMTRQPMPDKLYLPAGWQWGVQYEAADVLDTFTDIFFTFSRFVL